MLSAVRTYTGSQEKMCIGPLQKSRKRSPAEAGEEKLARDENDIQSKVNLAQTLVF